MQTIEQTRPGTAVRVTTADGYEAAGRLIGLTRDRDRPMVRLVGADQLEYRVPIGGATVTAA